MVLFCEFMERMANIEETSVQWYSFWLHLGIGGRLFVVTPVMHQWQHSSFSQLVAVTVTDGDFMVR